MAHLIHACAYRVEMNQAHDNVGLAVGALVLLTVPPCLIILSLTALLGVILSHV